MKHRMNRPFGYMAVSIVWLGVILSVVTTATAGEYDGLWINKTMPEVTDIVMVRHTGGHIVMVFLVLEEDAWDAFFGPISGNTANVTTLVSEIQADATITFNSSTSMTLTIVSCNPAEECPPPGTKVPWEKLF